MPKATPRKHPRPPASPAPHVHEVVDPRWIASAFAAVLLFALLCAFLTACGLFYRGQWQLALQPSRTVSRSPAALNLPFTEVHFGVDASGQPQLDGWWLPAASTAPTALLLHGASGSLSDALPTASLLHETGLNVLLFDYRGFGRSGGQHPDQQLMQQDAADALRYLTEIRSIPAAQVVVFGEGLGASLAVELCAEHPELRALILDNADGDLKQRALLDPRSHFIPARLLFNQTFPLAGPLSTLHTPKLLITQTTGAAPAIFREAADPKTTLELSPNADPKLIQAAIHRFLGDSGLPWAPSPANSP